jgi:NAD(P)-dependent dehydrogenase (short-subunit alcohol dehydrogenase family)
LEAETTLSSLAGAGHVLVGADISNPADAVALMDTVLDELGGVDVLVNNAAVNKPHPPATTNYPDWVAAWQHHIGVNLLATANLSHLAATRMITLRTPRPRPRRMHWASPRTIVKV